MKVKLIVFLIGLVVSFNTMSQVNLPNPEPEEVPVDGGISVLLASGIAYGAKKILDANKNKE